MLNIANVSHEYQNGTRALSGINLSIPRGVFGLLGPNGAGKSTLMRTIATLQRPSQGTLKFNDIDILSSPMALRKILGYLPQEFGVYPKGSAERLLHHLGILKGLTDKPKRMAIIEDLLIRTNLYSSRKKHVSTYSGGMLRRFGIAQALLGSPQLIIVDEPTAGLDPQERHRFNNLLSEIGESTVVILSTHIVADVADLCSQLAIMAGGEIVETGSPATLIDQLAGSIWEKRVNRQEHTDYHADHNVISTRFSLGQLVIRVNSETQPDDNFSKVKPTLEDVYFTVLSEYGGMM